MNQRKFYALLEININQEGRLREATALIENAGIHPKSKSPDQTFYETIPESRRTNVLDFLMSRGLFTAEQGTKKGKIKYSPTPLFNDFWNTYEELQRRA